MSASISWPCAPPPPRYRFDSSACRPRSFAPARDTGRHGRAHLDPRHLDVRNHGIAARAAPRRHQRGFAETSAGRARPLRQSGALHVHERERHELGEPCVSHCSPPDVQQGGAPSAPACRVPEHDRRVVRRPVSCAARMTSSHCCVSSLSGHRTRRTSSSRISAAVPGNVASPASLSRAGMQGSSGQAFGAPCVTSSGEKRSAQAIVGLRPRLTARDDRRDRSRPMTLQDGWPALQARPSGPRRKSWPPAFAIGDLVACRSGSPVTAQASARFGGGPSKTRRTPPVVRADVRVVVVAVDDVA
jgi:hypothetical protein